MTGVEIDFVVKNSLEALELYKKIFDVVTIEVTNFPTGENEAIFSIYDTRFHMLDENPNFQLFAPKEDSSTTFWFNVIVDNIEKTYGSAIENSCLELQGVTKMEKYGVTNAMFKDPFGYIWMLHEVHREVSFEERIEIWEEERQ